jgi:2-polyprenyl-3-methyl-5-hydroxy-6-metoxy-1,4-benzoquinol methylase
MLQYKYEKTNLHDNVWLVLDLASCNAYNKPRVYVLDSGCPFGIIKIVLAKWTDTFDPITWNN